MARWPGNTSPPSGSFFTLSTSRRVCPALGFLCRIRSEFFVFNGFKNRTRFAPCFTYREGVCENERASQLLLSFRCSLTLHFRMRTNKNPPFFHHKVLTKREGNSPVCCVTHRGGFSELGRPRPLMANKYAELRPLRLRPGRRRGRGQNRRRRPPAGHVAAPAGPVLLPAPAVRYATVPRQRLVLRRPRRRPSRKLGGGRKESPFTFASLLP
jgi:hypothetical protein